MDTSALPAELDLRTLPEAKLLRAEKCRRSYPYFLRQAWPVLEPGVDFSENWHIDLIAEHLQAVTERQIRRLVINIQPRVGKSINVSVLWPTWTWMWEPSSRWIFSSYDQSLSTQLSVDRRTVIESEWYKDHFGHIVELSKDENQKGEFSNTARGRMISTSIGSNVLGKGGSYIVIDDPMDAERAFSRAHREQAKRFIRNTLMTRLDNKRTGVIVMIMQRLHTDDPTAMMLQEGGWHHLCIPTVAPKPQQYVFPISGKVFARPEGHLMWEDREGPRELAEMKKVLGEYGYSGQYQQNPVPVGGAMVKREWIQHWDRLPERFDEMVLSADLTFTENSKSDFVVIQTWARKGPIKYLLDQRRERMGFTKTVAAIKRMKLKWPQASSTYIEEKANGHAVIEELKRKISGVIGVNPGDRDKISRLAAELPEFESGCVLLPPIVNQWVKEYIERLCAFPSVDFDDEIDTTSQAIMKLKHHTHIGAAFPVGIEQTAQRALIPGTPAEAYF